MAEKTPVVSADLTGPVSKNIQERNEKKWAGPRLVLALNTNDRLALAFYEAQCAENIKRRVPIAFSEGLVTAQGGPTAATNTILELTKWVKIALSRKKYPCNFCALRTLPQRCAQECPFFARAEGCLAGELCHERHVVNAPGEVSSEKNRPLFLTPPKTEIANRGIT